MSTILGIDGHEGRKSWFERQSLYHGEGKENVGIDYKLFKCSGSRHENSYSAFTGWAWESRYIGKECVNVTQTTKKSIYLTFMATT